MSRAALALLLCGCEPTQLVVVVDTDLEPGVEVSAIDVSVAGDRVFPDHHEFSLDSTELPFSLGVAPAHADDEGVFISARAFAPDGSIRAHFRMETHFVPHQARLLEVPLARACAESACEGMELTCVRGECVSPVIDAASLPLYDGALAPLFDARVAPDAGVPDAGGCVDGASCETGSPCEVGAVSCSPEPVCEVVSTLAPGTDCGSGRTCDPEGRCVL